MKQSSCKSLAIQAAVQAVYANFDHLYNKIGKAKFTLKSISKTGTNKGASYFTRGRPDCVTQIAKITAIDLGSYLYYIW